MVVVVVDGEDTKKVYQKLIGFYLFFVFMVNKDRKKNVEVRTQLGKNFSYINKLLLLW